MPAVDVAMAASLRPPAWKLIRDAVARGVAQDLSKRSMVQDTQNQITDVTTAFSSWDNCMKASFCKWPVIAIIVIVSLIVFSVVWCIIRCCCCGLSCCCTCFSCLKCCGDCCGCCDPPGSRKKKYLDEPYIPPNQGQGYTTQAPMKAQPPVPVQMPMQAQPMQAQPLMPVQMPTPVPGSRMPVRAPMQMQSQMQTNVSAPTPPPARFQPPQYAEYDVSRKAAVDTLPVMPSWESARTHKVFAREDADMSNLRGSPPLDQTRQQINAPPSPGPVSPISTKSMDFNGQSHGGPPGSPYGHMSSHTRSGSVPNEQPASYGQPRPIPGPGFYATKDPEHHQNYNANRLSDGFGLDEPYDELSPISSVATYGNPGHKTQQDGISAQRPQGNLSNQSRGVIAATGTGVCMGMRDQTASPQHPQPYGAQPVGACDSAAGSKNRQLYSPPPPAISAATASVGPESSAPDQAQTYHQIPHGQEQVREQMAEMPAVPHGRSSIHGTDRPRQAQISPTKQTAPMELPGSVLPEAHGMSPPPAASHAAPVLDRWPLGVESRMRSSPGPMTPELRGDGPPAGPPRGSPRLNQGYARSPSQARPDAANGTFLSDPPRPPAQGPGQRFYPGTEQQNSPAPSRQVAQRPERRFPPNPEWQNSPAPSRQPAQGPERHFPPNSEWQNSPAPSRQPAQGPERHFTPGPERLTSPDRPHQYTSASRPLNSSVPPLSSSSSPSSPPESIMTNKAGFDFTSGYSRPQDNQSPTGQSATTAAYPGQRTYQPGR